MVKLLSLFGTSRSVQMQCVVVLCFLFSFFGAIQPVFSATSNGGKVGELPSVELTRQIRSFFPGADNIGGLLDQPRVWPEMTKGEVVGWAFVTSDIVDIPAYSGKPVVLLLGLDTLGDFVGVSVL